MKHRTSGVNQALVSDSSFVSRSTSEDRKYNVVPSTVEGTIAASGGKEKAGISVLLREFSMALLKMVEITVVERTYKKVIHGRSRSEIPGPLKS